MNYRAISSKKGTHMADNSDEAALKTNAEPSETESPKVKFEIYGEEMIEKKVKLSGNSGRVKIIRVD